MSKNAVVIVAAGRGERLGGDGPKQYRQLAGKTVLQRTVDCFTAHRDIDIVQVVIHADDAEMYQHNISDHPKLLSPVVGGSTRQASCRAGVDALSPHQPHKVLIHDAARPFVSEGLISRVIEGIGSRICALPAIAVADTVKRTDLDGLVTETIDRNNLYMAQTPQGFVWHEILDAHRHAAENAGNREFTDDAAIAERAEIQVKVVAGERENFKITNPEDLTAAEAKLKMLNNVPDIRVGSGYDVHTLGPGDGVILCGVYVPHDRALQGHSDADVGLHALTDALLGTIGDGDIGSHFPPSDPQWKGASSDQFLAHAVKLVRNQGGALSNLDVTLVCEAPKIGPHRDTMRTRIADICGIENMRVSVKATTNEGIGFIGRQEGIAALATATVSFGA